MHFLAEIPIIKFAAAGLPDQMRFLPLFLAARWKEGMNHMEIPVLNEIMRDTVVEVDLDRIAFNVRQIKAMAGPGTQVAAVVKADGYGHGALGIAPAIMENGACLLAVAIPRAPWLWS